MTRCPRGKRGQATLELALGSLLVVTIMIFGIQFAEASMLTLKVQEAATFAIWDATGRRVHSFNGAAASYAPFTTLVTRAGPMATARYRDFVGTGASSADNYEARAQATGMNVVCTPDASIAFRVADPRVSPAPGDNGHALRHGAVLADLDSFYRPDLGGMTCEADAEIGAVKIPMQFLEGANGFFQAEHLPRPTMRVCSSRWCNGKFGVLLGTWALEGPAGNRNNAEVPLGSAGPNSTYHDLVLRLFDANGRGEGTPSRAKAFAGAIAGEASPGGYDEDTFYMSYRGQESGYAETLVGRSGKMGIAGEGTQSRGYDTNGAPQDVANRNVWEWKAPGSPAFRPCYFLGLPLEAP